MLARVERETLRRLGTVELLLGIGCIVAGISPAHPAAVLHAAPAALGLAVVAGGLLLVLGSVFPRHAGECRGASLALVFGAIALLHAAAAGQVSLPVTVPAQWDAIWTPGAIVVAMFLSGAASPAALAIVAAVAAIAAGWYSGCFPLAAGASAAVLATVVATAPLRRQSGAADLPDRLAQAAGQGEVTVTNAGAQGDISPLAEADLRAGAATLATDDLAVLVNDTSRRQRTPMGDLHVLRRGRYSVQRVMLDVAHAQESDALGFFAPAGMVFTGPQYVKQLNGQAGVVGRIVVPGWTADDGRLGHRDTARDALLALLAATWSLRLDNHRLARDAEARLLDIVESLITSVEAKDQYTSGHSKRVCKYSLLLAEALGVTGRELEEVAIGAALHDVGKLGIPEQLLSKPAKLDDAEWGVMRSHPKVGARIIDSFNQSDAVLHMIFHHHERFDGRGYPAGLKGEDIPFHARIVGVADALDAMTSGRVYQRNRAVRDALEEVRRGAGTQFDPKVVAALDGIPIAKLEEIAPKLPPAPIVTPPQTPVVATAPAKPLFPLRVPA